MHHAQEPFDKVVAGTMAIVAALLAVVSAYRTALQHRKAFDAAEEFRPVGVLSGKTSGAIRRRWRKIRSPR